AHASHVMEPGDIVVFSDFQITYEGSPFSRSEENRSVIGVRLKVERSSGRIATLEPRLNIYPAWGMAIPTPHVMHGLTGDLYVTLLDLDETHHATLTFDTSPMIILLWVGGFTTAAGGFWAVAVRRRERREAADR